MNEDRRSFLKKAGCTALGVGCGLPLLATGCNSGDSADGECSQWAMIIDVKKCLDPKVRDACAGACNAAHRVPEIADPEEKIEWIWSESYEHVFPDQVHEHTATATKEAQILVLCNHCTNPPCVKVCPTQATWKRKSDGVVMMDMHRCIGCRYCIAACPYGARSFNWSDPHEHLEKDENAATTSYPTRTKGVVEKCTFCTERIRAAGEDDEVVPVCVEAVNKIPGGEGALTFGRLTDPKISRILDEQPTICRRVGLGTGPNVFYIV